MRIYVNDYKLHGTLLTDIYSRVTGR